MSSIGNFFRWIFGLSPIIEQRFPIDEELIERDDVVKEVVKKVQSQDAQLSKRSALDKEKQELEKQRDKDQEKIQDLIIQKHEIDSNKFKGAISLRTILKKLDERAFRNKVEITDKDDKIVFGILKDFVIFNGMFGIKDTEDRIISYGKTLRQIVHKPESFGNQIRRKRIMLPCNEYYQFFPDIEEHELPECTYDEEAGKIKWAKIREKPLKQMIEEREEILREKDSYIEKIEQDKVDLVRKLRDTERALRVNTNIAENDQSELSKAMDRSIQFEQKIGDLQMRVVQLQEIKNINEKLVAGLKEVNKELLDKAEEFGSKTMFTKVLQTVQNLIEWSKINQGDTIIQKQEVNEKTEGQAPGQAR